LKKHFLRLAFGGMSLKILFLESPGSKVHFFARVMRHPLLGPLWMATKLKQLGYDVKVIKENLVDQEEFNAALAEADLLILTVLTIFAKRSIEVAQEFKRLRPNGKVIAGGVHISLNPEESLQYYDQVVVGEGVKIIQDLVDGKIPDRVVHAPPVDSLEEHPVIDFSVLVNYKKLKMIPIMTSLGCPFGCNFCCVTRVYGRGYRTQTAEKTIAEIKSYFQQLGKRRVFFFDDNLCANKKRSLELFDKIREEQLRFVWYCQVRADLANDEAFIARMAEVGCRRVYVGFESICDATLKDMKKQATKTVFENAIRVFHKYGITVHGMFIFGTDQDDQGVFDRTVDFCLLNHMEAIQFFAITPFPGTELFEKIEKSRFLTFDTDYYDNFHAIVKPNLMTEYQLVMGLLHAHERFYSVGNMLRQLGHDIIDIFRNHHRTFCYLVLKMANNLMRNIGFRIMIKKWRASHHNYHAELEAKMNVNS
jgi:anaerobic magnesium-protoporphyrin IX monomethyl ester cyclase